MTQTRVFFSHDGNVDDILSLAMLLGMKNVDIVGVAATAADSYAVPAYLSMEKLLSLMKRTDIPIGFAKSCKGVPGQDFPLEFKRYSCFVEMLPILNETWPGRDAEPDAATLPSAEDLLIRTLEAEPDGGASDLVFLETGPLSLLAEVLRRRPDLGPRIKRVVWMGGAIHAPGNVCLPFGPAWADGTAEWNVFWDPSSAADVFESPAPFEIFMCPLDLTNHVPVTRSFVLEVARQRRYPLSEVAASCYAYTVASPEHASNDTYFFWDTLTTAYVGNPSLFEATKQRVRIVREGPSAGRTEPVATGGREVFVLSGLDKPRFFEYFMELLRAEIPV